MKASIGGSVTNISGSSITVDVILINMAVIGVAVTVSSYHHQNITTSFFITTTTTTATTITTTTTTTTLTTAIVIIINTILIISNSMINHRRQQQRIIVIAIVTAQNPTLRLPSPLPVASVLLLNVVTTSWSSRSLAVLRSVTTSVLPNSSPKS